MIITDATLEAIDGSIEKWKKIVGLQGMDEGVDKRKSEEKMTREPIHIIRHPAWITVFDTTGQMLGFARNFDEAERMQKRHFAQHFPKLLNWYAGIGKEGDALGMPLFRICNLMTIPVRQ